MSFYLKKALRFGPIRFNLSKSGIGVSAGIKGFRIGTGPRGTYVHAGRGGIYYRKQFSAAPSVSQGSYRLQQEHISDAVVPLEEVESGSLDPGTVAAELTQKRRLIPMWPWMLGGSVLSYSLIVWGEAQPLLLISAGIALAICCIVSAVLDKQRKSSWLLFSLEEPVASAFGFLNAAFENVCSSGLFSRFAAREYYADSKYHAGAFTGLQRVTARPQRRIPPHVKTNVTVYGLPGSSHWLYFFPDRILVFSSRTVNGIQYSELNATLREQRFIENEGVPSDAKVIGQTWRYVNKTGGPDLRFKNNCQLPIVVYAELEFASPSGLRETYQISNYDGAARLLDAIKRVTNALTPENAHLEHSAGSHGGVTEAAELPNVVRFEPFQSFVAPHAEVTPEDEELVKQSIEIIRQEKRASTSLLQRRLRLGYTRAARIVDILEQRGILGPGEGAKPREILVDLDAAV